MALLLCHCLQGCRHNRCCAGMLQTLLEPALQDCCPSNGCCCDGDQGSMRAVAAEQPGYSSALLPDRHPHLLQQLHLMFSCNRSTSQAAGCACSAANTAGCTSPAVPGTCCPELMLAAAPQQQLPCCGCALEPQPRLLQLRLWLRPQLLQQLQWQQELALLLACWHVFCCELCCCWRCAIWLLVLSGGCR